MPRRSMKGKRGHGSATLVTAERSAGTVVLWLRMARAVFRFGVEQRLIRGNPWPAVKVTVPRRTITRDRSFTPEEANTILAAALASDNPAKRWAPWLMAYSGARIGEVMALRGSDIERHGDFWAMRIAPGKTRQARTVPLHEHLIEQGFGEFVRQRGAGRLFGGSAASLARWVRSLGVGDPGISPNHAWRHLFKLLAHRAGMSERAADAICGHAPASVGRAYGKPSVADLARELAKLPRFKVE
jgi:integrase